MLRSSTTPYQGRCAVHGGRSTIGTKFSGNTEITAFNELIRFTGISSIAQTAFQGCTNLESIAIPSQITTIQGYQFRYCANLASVTLPPALTSIGDGAFGSSKLTSIELPPTLKTLGHYAFSSNLFVTLELPASITTLGQSVFSGCSLLTTVTCHATTPPTGNGFYFQNCNALTAIYVPAASVDAYKADSKWSSYASKIQAIP